MFDIIKSIFDAILALVKPNLVFERALQNSSQVQGLVNVFLEEIEADRVLVYQYHNGGHYYHGHSMQKQSCSYEALGSGISTIMRNQQNLLISESPELHEMIVNTGHVGWEDTKSVEDPILRADLYRQGSKSFYSTVIKNLQGQIIGHIDVHYVLAPKMLRRDTDQERIERFALEISGYLSNVASKEQATITLYKLGGIFFGLLALAELLHIMVYFKELVGW